ncbi:class I SAM-dependent methyltransferase family protein [Candidatus Bathyarchaeota archaeon]|nr:class I SAM-dependent methyltransferase family protein [Candidatus Bathyarchaeota archaeon]
MWRKLRKRLKNILAGILPQNELVYIYNSYDIVGDIAILRLTVTSKKHAPTIAEAIMNVHKNVKTVLAQTSPIYGDFKLRKLEYVTGENKTATVHREFGCLFSVDVAKCYFSPRLFHERMRIAKQARNGEVIVNMFAGVGCFSIVIAKHSSVKKVYSIDINPEAVQNIRKSISMNRVYGKVVPLLGDAKEVIEKSLRRMADRVLMPLPEKAYEYLPYALLALKETGGWVHYYDFEHARKGEDPIEKVNSKVAERLKYLNVKFEIPFCRVIRTTGPNWYQIVLDIRIFS